MKISGPLAPSCLIRGEPYPCSSPLRLFPARREAIASAASDRTPPESYSYLLVPSGPGLVDSGSALAIRPCARLLGHSGYVSRPPRAEVENGCADVTKQGVGRNPQRNRGAAGAPGVSPQAFSGCKGERVMARPSSYRCSECDQLGHNARTCVAAKAAAVESQLALAMWWGSMLTAENARLRSLAGEPLKPGVGGAPYDGSPVVYFLHYDNGATKVGWASDLRRRLRDHHGSAPGGIVLLAAVRAERCVETDYHRRFAAMRDHHEFFRLEQHHIPETDFDVAPLNEERARCGFRKTCPVCGRTFVAAVPIR